MDFNQICCYFAAFHLDIFLHFHEFLGFRRTDYCFLSIQLITLIFFFFTYSYRMTSHGVNHLYLVLRCIAEWDVFYVKPIDEWKRFIMYKYHCITAGKPWLLVSQRDPKTECQGFVYLYLNVYITTECP